VSDDLFARIRAACARVAERAEWVEIDEGGLGALAETLAREEVKGPSPDPTHHAFADPDDTLAYVVTMDAINFGSGWFPVLRKRDGCSGYLTIATALRERFERCGAWSADELVALTPDDCVRVFDQQKDPDARELMALFASALNELGALLACDFGGRFAALVDSAGGSAARLVRILTRMPFYRDVAWHAGEPVPLYKRAQITAADLAAAFGGEGPGYFVDLHRLTLFADNLVPHVLRRSGVLRYATGLARRIDAGERLTAGSVEEVEIRAVAVHAVERLVLALRARGTRVDAHQLDHRLWTRGQAPDMKARPRHRARSVYY
jgi:hypothetical protein